MQSAEIVPSKSEDEKPVPIAWRPVLTEIADRLAEGDYKLSSRPANVSPIGDDLAALIEHQITSYGDKPTRLLNDTWERSVYLWMDDHWEVIVDLCTKAEVVSDLSMFVKVIEQTADFRFEVTSVHVP